MQLARAVQYSKITLYDEKRKQVLFGSDHGHTTNSM